MSLGGLLMRKGAPVTWTTSTPGTDDPTTGTTTTPVITTITGLAMEIDGDPDLYLALSLVESMSPTLLFKPTTPGQIPALDSTVVWGGAILTAKNIKPLALAGTPTEARIVCSR